MRPEYAIDAQRFATALREQRQMRLKGGIYHLTQILMAYHSNQIEGGQLSQEQTRFIYETRTVVGDAHVNDVVETDNHFRAFDAALDHVGQPITAATLKNYHRHLKEATADSRKDGFVVGGWKTTTNKIGDTTTTPPADVDAAIEDLIKRTPTTMRLDNIVDWHVSFERIHPFQDGNGRVGRLVMLEQCLAHGVMPFIVLADNKTDYYRGLEQYDTEPEYLRATCRQFQDFYYARFQKFIPPE